MFAAFFIGMRFSFFQDFLTILLIGNMPYQTLLDLENSADQC